MLLVFALYHASIIFLGVDVSCGCMTWLADEQVGLATFLRTATLAGVCVAVTIAEGPRAMAKQPPEGAQT